MSRLKRFGFAQFAVVLLMFGCGAAAGALYGGGVNADIKSHTAANDAARAYERSARIEIDANCIQLAGSQKAYCFERALRRAREQQRQEYELETYRQAAIWQGVAGKSAAVGLIFSIFTILVVYFTFLQQQAGNRVSIVGLKDARRRARDTLAHSQAVSRQGLRPYVFVEKIDVRQTGAKSFQLVIWFKNFGRTPARKIQTKLKTYIAETIDDLRDFSPEDLMELGVAAPDHQRRAFWPLNFTDDEWANPSWACYAVLRVQYTYEDDGGNVFTECGDYFAEKHDLIREDQWVDEPYFFLLTEGAQQRHARNRESEPDLFTPENIKRIREDNLQAEREERAKYEAEIRERMARLDANPKVSKPTTKKKPAPPAK